MFASLMLWIDLTHRTAAGQMAVDEALLRTVSEPVLRIYQWAAPALTFGYAQRVRETCRLAVGRDLVRRWTGGGVVFHGNDLTVGLVIPGAPQASSSFLYHQIHTALSEGLRDVAQDLRLAVEEDCSAGPECFVSPAPHDLLSGGRKICGGALRRSRAGTLYQGSIQSLPLPAPEAIASGFSKEIRAFAPCPQLECEAGILEREKYSTEAWNSLR